MATTLASRVDAVRAFSRFYTRRLGLLHEGLLGGPLSLTEGRVVWELGQGDTTAARLCERLGLDPGHLSRILRRFGEAGLIARTASEADGRTTLLSLTPAGRDAYAAIDARSAEEVRTMLAALPGAGQDRLVQALATAEALLSGPPDAPVTLRALRPGDLGWVVHRQGALYAQEWGLDARFEALVARVVADFVATFDPARERAWIAERDGAVLGSIFLVRHDDAVAKLRLMYVEPSARGLGIGQRLVSTVIRFARARRYARITLWTTSNLVSARRIYEAAGFALTHEAPHDGFGRPLVGQTWELTL